MEHDYESRSARWDGIRGTARSMGASLCEGADLTPLASLILDRYGETAASYPRAVSIAVAFPAEVVFEQAEAPTRTYDYFYHAINRQLDSVCLAVSVYLQREGWRAYPVPTSDYRESVRVPGLQRKVAEEGAGAYAVSGTDLRGMFSHRLAAWRSGMGWIGKSCHLVTPEFGPRVRLTTVLTDAPIPVGSPVPDRCGTCTRCRDACPAGAIRGVAFDPADPPEKRIDARKCRSFLHEMRDSFGQPTCAMCLSVCPWGRGGEKQKAKLTV